MNRELSNPRHLEQIQSVAEKIGNKKQGISDDLENQKVNKIKSDSEMEQILKKIANIDREISKHENMLKLIDRHEQEPPVDTEIPDYKALGTFRIDKILQESPLLENKESSEFDFGIISKAIHVMKLQINQQQKIIY